jgi:hypothetical protein
MLAAAIVPAPAEAMISSESVQLPPPVRPPPASGRAPPWPVDEDGISLGLLQAQALAERRQRVLVLAAEELGPADPFECERDFPLIPSRRQRSSASRIQALGRAEVSPAR